MTLADYLRTTETTQAAFAARLGVTQSLISQWISGETRVAAEMCMRIERATVHQVRCEELRPDLDWAVLRGRRRKVA